MSESGFVNHAKRELDLIGMTEDNEDEMNRAMREHILHMIQEFADEGHSGFSASYASNILSKLFKYEPLSPLTGEDSEWNEVGEGVYQNKRCSHVFKNENGAYDIDGIVFWEWNIDTTTGEKYKTCFTNRDSRVPVTFPYIPTTEYKEYEEEQQNED